ncbi:MAG TPA: serine/threonine-protein kinase [Planctomycetota bacterium]|nr:serine/threonine-protein kinase [Planctomycetota bacterium]
MATNGASAPELDEDFRYGQLAIEGRLITPDQFDTAMDRVRDSKKPLADILVTDGTIDATTADRLTKALRRIVRDERAKSEGGMLVNKQIGGYKLVRRIGEDGMGKVYLAEQLTMHRTVALKILHNKWADDEEFRKRFLLEARAAGKLNHQNLIQVYDVNKYQGKYYFSMEFIDGVTVEDLIRHEGALPVEKVIDICMQVCQALKYLANHNIVHRDIKPANIMVTKDGTVKLGDFGFIQSVWDAELMQEGTTIGTPDYISPEQARGERNLDVRSDIYSLGASLFHMLTGKTLFQGSCSKVMRDHIETEPPKLDDLRKDLPKDLKRMLGKMTAKQPIDRYQTPDEVIKDLDLLRIDVAHKDGAIPSSRSQIMNVITAEKERIATLETVIATKSQQITALLVLMGLGWILAASCFAMWMINAK